MLDLGTLELKIKTTGAEEVEKSFDRTKTAAQNLSKVGKVALSAMGAVATATLGSATAAIKFGNDYKKAINGFIAETGIATEKAGEFEKSIKNIYSKNFGESIEDVASAMGEVAKNSKETDPEKLEKLTTNAIALRDTFDFEITETMRSVNMLMDQFGISGEEAFNLIVQGAQNGLDKNGDLLDSINEYSVHFKQLGLDADEMFNSLANGTAAGTFSVDKLGDSVKEFGIRAKDGSDSTKQAFKDLGLDADKMTRAFARGGENGKKAFSEVTNALFSTKDAVKQNEIGVALFGTMWEDLGKDGIAALTNLNGGISKTEVAMDELMNVKYNTPLEAFEGIRRSLETNVLIPISENLMPVINEVASIINAHMPQIQQTLQKAIDEVFKFGNWVFENKDVIIAGITGIGTSFLTWNVTNLIVGVIGTVKNLISAVKTGKTAMQAFNAVCNANPYALVATAIVGIVSALYALCKASDDSNDKTSELTQKLKEQKKEYEGLQKTIDQKTSSQLSEIGHTEKLVSELKSLVNENGEVKEGYKDRVSFILGELNGALGTEYSLVGNTIEKYGELCSTIDNVIAKKRAMIIVENMEEGYKAAVQNIGNVQEAMTKYSASMEEMKKGMQDAWNKGDIVNYAGMKMEYDRLEKLFNDNLKTYQKYTDDITKYEETYAKATSDNMDEVRSVYDNHSSSLKKWTGDNRAELKKQVDDTQAYYDQIQGKVQEGLISADDAIVQNAATARDNALAEYQKAGQAVGEGITSGVGVSSPSALAATKELAWGTINEMEAAGLTSNGANPKTQSMGVFLVQGLASGVKIGENSLTEAIRNLCTNALKHIKTFFGINSPAKKTIPFGQALNEGMAVGIENNMSAEEALKKKSENILKVLNEYKEELDFEKQLAEDEYTLWITENPDVTVSEREIKRKEKETKLLEINNNMINNANLAYEKQVKLTGAESTEAKKLKSEIVGLRIEYGKLLDVSASENYEDDTAHLERLNNIAEKTYELWKKQNAGASSSEKYSKQQKYLNEQIKNQKEKVEKLEEAYEHAKKTTGEFSEETEELKEELIDEKITLEDLADATLMYRKYLIGNDDLSREIQLSEKRQELWEMQNPNASQDDIYKQQETRLTERLINRGDVIDNLTQAWEKCKEETGENSEASKELEEQILDEKIAFEEELKVLQEILDAKSKLSLFNGMSIDDYKDQLNKKVKYDNLLYSSEYRKLLNDGYTWEQLQFKAKKHSGWDGVTINQTFTSPHLTASEVYNATKKATNDSEVNAKL